MTAAAESKRRGRSAAANARKAKERADKRAAGLVPIEVWCRPHHKDAVREFVAALDQRSPSA